MQVNLPRGRKRSAKGKRTRVPCQTTPTKRQRQTIQIQTHENKRTTGHRRAHYDRTNPHLASSLATASKLSKAAKADYNQLRAAVLPISQVLQALTNNWPPLPQRTTRAKPTNLQTFTFTILCASGQSFLVRFLGSWYLSM